MSPVLQLLIPIAGFGLLAWTLSGNLTSFSLILAEKLGAVAHPNERSSHQEPTPRIGGLGPMITVLVLCGVLFFAFGFVQRTVFPTLNYIDTIPILTGVGFLATVFGAMILGLLDDLGKIGTAGKFIGQAVIAVIPVATGLTINQLEFPFLSPFEIPGPVSWFLTWFWIVLMMNVVNFMDGINGLAGRFMEIFGIALVVMAVNLSWRYEIVWLGAIICGAGVGFLPYNLGQARTFMGDCGSQALGALVACAGLLIHNNSLDPINGTNHMDPFLTVVILAFPLIFDVGLTLVRRMMRGENILKAHREHLYQRYLIANGEDHAHTLSFVTNFFYLAALGGIIYNRIAFQDDMVRLFVILAVVGAMIYQMHRVQQVQSRSVLENG